MAIPGYKTYLNETFSYIPQEDNPLENASNFLIECLLERKKAPSPIFNFGIVPYDMKNAVDISENSEDYYQVAYHEKIEVFVVPAIVEVLKIRHMDIGTIMAKKVLSLSTSQSIGNEFDLYILFTFLKKRGQGLASLIKSLLPNEVKLPNWLSNDITLRGTKVLDNGTEVHKYLAMSSNYGTYYLFIQCILKLSITS